MPRFIRTRSSKTMAFWDMHKGHFLLYNYNLYGPWKGRDEAGYRWDFFDVHDWAVKNLGVCPWRHGKQCNSENCGRPEHLTQAREQKRKSWDHSDLPLFEQLDIEEK